MIKDKTIKELCNIQDKKKGERFETSGIDEVDRVIPRRAPRGWGVGGVAAVDMSDIEVRVVAAATSSHPGTAAATVSPASTNDIRSWFTI